MKRFYSIVMVVLFLASVAIAGTVQANNALVSSDGNVVAVAETEAAAGGNVSASFKGRGGTAVEGLRAEGVITESVPMSELMALKPVTAPIGIETILGFDSRVRTYPNTFPRRAVGLLTFSAGRCTAWLIGNNTVATAGHCVAAGGSRTFYPVGSYRFYAGYGGANYGVCTARTLYTVTGWINSGLDDFDYGLIKLNCTVGNNTGWFGFFWTSGSLLNEPTVISGYPGDKPTNQQWESVDKVRVNQAKRTFYKNDTVGGMSGSPVWSDRPPGAPFAQNGAYGMAVHAYGTYNGAPYSTHNHGTRIDQSVFNNFITVKNLP